MAAPLTVGTRRIGVVSILVQTRSSFFEDDLALLQLLANQTAIVLEHRRLFEEVHSLNRTLERNVSELRALNDELGSFAYSVSHDLRAPLRQVEFESNGAPTATCDERLVRIALTNLLSNSWKFTRRREPAHISFSGDTRGGEAVFCVKDDGVGFDMRYADKLFGAFQRLHKTSEFEGSGIGLATVQRIVHRHGGRVWAESEVDKG